MGFLILPKNIIFKSLILFLVEKERKNNVLFFYYFLIQNKSSRACCFEEQTKTEKPNLLVIRVCFFEPLKPSHPLL